MCVLASGSWALGLGRLQVQSALGETLRAEIDVTSLTPDEAASLQVRVAPPESYRAAGLDYNAVLPSTRATLVRRPDGRAVLRLTSDRPVQEPFVDVILEMTWASGRLVREYTLLLDPPRVMPAPPVQATAPAATSPVAPSAQPAAPVAAAPAPAAAPPAPAAPARRPAAAAPEPPAAARPTAQAEPAGQVTVRAGDTLSAIAQRHATGGVSLEQMLVSLYRANPQAFIQNNMNLLRAGAVLSVPGADFASQVSRDEALRTIRAQSDDFNAYRQRLAGIAPKVGTDEPGQRAAGRVQARVEDRTPTAAAEDRLKLSQGAVQPSAPEARVSREAEQRDTSTRVAELRRNVEELERLQQAARPAAQAPAASAPAPAAASDPAAAASAPAPVAAAPASAPAAASAPVLAPAVPATPPAPRPARPAPPPPAAEPDFVTTLLDNPLVLPGAGVLVALLGGLGIYRLRRKVPAESSETSFLESRSAHDSFFGATGGARVDTRQSTTGDGTSTSSTYGLSQLDAIGDVDPVAEADVYLAYGRDLQAEEILKEAMRANPDRLAIRTKLLEVYAKRRDAKGFEALATQLYGLTHGEGEDWLKAQELGRQIDPENPLYQAGGQPAAGVAGAERAVAALGATTMPQSVLPVPSGPDSRQPLEPLPAMDLDLDLDLGEPAPHDIVSAPVPLMETTQPMVQAPSQVGGDSQLDFELPVEPETPRSQPAAAPAAPLAFNLDGLSLDLDVPAAPTPSASAAAPAAVEPPMLDFGSIKGGEPLDLPPADEMPADPMQRKLELADEFRQIGDIEGARDLLEEVVAKGGEALKARAQAMLDTLG
ncbi:FimV/HubP family polar landmark protein [Azohydromonas sediminis]|uniref:FimV/HubP family polar landmark protein n=1 Tax=Azohydromonas sediminis TaxID=2259674 RepID=UPI001F23CA21|nr:FimV/HubP family polar landmark protein [Azohydromonas sediminis]